MKKALIASIPLFLIIGVFALPVRADDTLAEFEGFPAHKRAIDIRNIDKE